jgi:hypothetical protein
MGVYSRQLSLLDGILRELLLLLSRLIVHDNDGCYPDENDNNDGLLQVEG